MRLQPRHQPSAPSWRASQKVTAVRVLSVFNMLLVRLTNAGCCNLRGCTCDAASGTIGWQRQRVWH